MASISTDRIWRSARSTVRWHWNPMLTAVFWGSACILGSSSVYGPLTACRASEWGVRLRSSIGDFRKRI
jgi:hypothetical protein